MAVQFSKPIVNMNTLKTHIITLLCICFNQDFLAEPTQVHRHATVLERISSGVEGRTMIQCRFALLVMNKV